MKASDVHGLNAQQLIERLRDARDEAFSLRLRHATGELENTSALTAAKRDVARLLTESRERGIDIETELSRFRERNR